MAVKTLECPVCGKHSKLDIPNGQMVYKCPHCKLTVRCQAPQKIEVPVKQEEKQEEKKEELEQKEEEVKTIEVDSAQEIPEKVAEEVNKAVEEKVAAKSSKKKKASKKKKKKS